MFSFSKIAPVYVIHLTIQQKLNFNFKEMRRQPLTGVYSIPSFQFNAWIYSKGRQNNCFCYNMFLSPKWSLIVRTDSARTVQNKELLMLGHNLHSTVNISIIQPHEIEYLLWTCAANKTKHNGRQTFFRRKLHKRARQCVLRRKNLYRWIIIQLIIQHLSL